MRFPGFIGPSYTLPSVNVDCQRCVNLIPQLNELGTGKEREVASLILTPGLSLLATIGDGAHRASKMASDGFLYVVNKNKVYKVTSTWTYSQVATLSTNTGPVSIADSGKRLAIVDGSTTGKFWTFATATESTIPFPTDIDFIPFNGCHQVVFQDGYFIYLHKDTGQFFISGLVNSVVADDATIDPLDFSSADGNPDPIIACISDHRDLWMIGSKTIEVFYNSGAAFPFERIQGAFIEHGGGAPFSVAKMNNTVYWLGQDDKGAGIIFEAKGYQPQRISTHALESAIRTYGDVSGATAYTYQDGGHFYYAINFPTAKTTWCFDSTTRLWHERVYNSNGYEERHRAETHAFAYSKHIVGDYVNGNLYEMSNDYRKDDTIPIIRSRTAPHLSDGLKRVTHHDFQLDMETGVGLDGIQQGDDPVVILQFSDDGGHSWSNEKWAKPGKIGQRKARCIWRRLGMSRDRVYKITMSDPVATAWIGAELNLEQAAS